jgi:3-hydroxybutyryl-CoA dehydrogenase
MGLVNVGLQTIENNLDKEIQEGNIEDTQKQQIMSRIRGTTDLADLCDVDLVIEAVVENIAIKKEIFAELDNICKPNTILATNTSSFSITEIASVTKNPARVLGMHFFNPVPSVKLVELIKGIGTTDDIIEKAKSFIENINKKYVVVKKDNPGFLVNRLLFPYLNEAIYIYAEGVASKEDIDTAMKLGAGMPQGPLELADNIGLDTLYSVVLDFYNEFKDPKYRPHPLLSTMVRGGYLGRKSGKGFYNYSE